MCLHLRSAIVAAIVVVVGAAGVKRADAIRGMISGRKERGWMMGRKGNFKNAIKFLNVQSFLFLLIEK